jgi:hypothetical protein
MALKIWIPLLSWEIEILSKLNWKAGCYMVEFENLPFLPLSSQTFDVEEASNTNGIFQFFYFSVYVCYCIIV